MPSTRASPSPWGPLFSSTVNTSSLSSSSSSSLLTFRWSTAPVGGGRRELSYELQYTPSNSVWVSQLCHVWWLWLCLQSDSDAHPPVAVGDGFATGRMWEWEWEAASTIDVRGFFFLTFVKNFVLPCLFLIKSQTIMSQTNIHNAYFYRIKYYKTILTLKGAVPLRPSVPEPYQNLNSVWKKR